MERVLIADDHPIFLDGLATLLSGAGFSVVARCTTGIEVLAEMQATNPDLLVLDVNMPAPTGLEIARDLKEAKAAVRIVLLSSDLDDVQILQAVDLGVEGIVLKESAPRQLVQCLETVRQGDKWIDPQVARRALDAARPQGPAPTLSRAHLTNREMQVTRLVAAGLRNKEIGRELGIGEGTVKMYLHTIYEKSGVSSRIELANFARKNRFL